MSSSRPMPNFPSRRSLHGSDADPDALERALKEVHEAMTGMIPIVSPRKAAPAAVQTTSVVSPAVDDADTQPLPKLEGAVLAEAPVPSQGAASDVALSPLSSVADEAAGSVLGRADSVPARESVAVGVPEVAQQFSDEELESTQFLPAESLAAQPLESKEPLSAQATEPIQNELPQQPTPTAPVRDSVTVEPQASDVHSTRPEDTLPQAEHALAQQEQTPPTPGLQRRSWKDRFADIDRAQTQREQEVPPTPSLGIPVGAGQMALPGDSFSQALTGAYSIISGGVFDKDLTDTGLVPVVEVVEEGDPLALQEAMSHHLFLIPEDVEPEEIEALAVSIWDEAAWAMPGTLRLVGEAYLRGPWRISPDDREVLGIPAHLTRAWMVETPRLRNVARGVEAAPASAPLTQPGTQAAPPVTDPWALAFPHGLPFGVEYKALLALVRMARRLGGALRIMGSGYVMAPHPQTAVHMSVYSSRWAAPSDIQLLLKETYPGVVDSRQMTGAAPLPQSPQEVRRVKSVLAGIKPPSPEVQRVLQKAREEAAKAPQRVDGYAMIVPLDSLIPGAGFVAVEVHRVLRPPRVLRWEPWTNGTIVEYAVRWTPADGPLAFVPMMDPNPDVQRLETSARVAKIVEDVAARVARGTGGTIVDEDGFLVGCE